MEPYGVLSRIVIAPFVLTYMLIGGIVGSFTTTYYLLRDGVITYKNLNK